MARPKKTKKAAQVEVVGQDPGAGDNQRNTDGNPENVADTAVAGGSGLGGRKSRSDTESTDSLMENARRRLQRRKRARILSIDDDNENESRRSR